MPLLHDANLYLIFLITLFAVLGVSSITPAFPAIVSYFGISRKEIGLLITAFTLPGIFLTPVMGVLADRAGRKNILIPSLILFGIGGFACTFARSFSLLIILRFIQGIGAASLGSINVTLIGDLYEGRRRTTAMGFNASILSVGTASYPAIGGALAMFGWHFPFILPILAIPLGIVIIFRLKNPEPQNNHKLRDYLLNTWQNINKKSVWGLFIINILIFVILYGAILTYFPLLLEDRFNTNALVIGLTMSSMSVSTALTSSLSGWLRSKFAGKSILKIGFSLYLIGLVLLPAGNNWIFMLLAVVIFGIGQGMNMPLIQTMLVSYAPLQERAAFMSINSMVLRLGQTIGPLIMALLYTIGGFTAAFFSAAGIALVMIAILIIMVK